MKETCYANEILSNKKTEQSISIDETQSFVMFLSNNKGIYGSTWIPYDVGSCLNLNKYKE